MVHYDVPSLAYKYGDLEPHISESVLELHHGTYHKEYAKGLNHMLRRMHGDAHPRHISTILAEISSVPETLRDEFEFFAGGYENHRFFWECLSPSGGGIPGGVLGDALDIYFGGFGGFRREFTSKAASIEGSGWAWLVQDPNRMRLEILATCGNSSPITIGRVPILACDMWEHAYYGQYEERRADYIESWWETVNWDMADARYSGMAK